MVCCQTIQLHDVMVDNLLEAVDMHLHNVMVANLVVGDVEMVANLVVGEVAYPMEGVAMVVVERLSTLVVEVLAIIVGVDGMTLATMELHRLVSLSHVDANGAMSPSAPCQL